MKRILLSFAAALAALSMAPAHAQSIYAGVGLPGLYTLGYQHQVNKSFGVRAQHSTGLKWSDDGNYEGVNARAEIKASMTGLFADWHPFEGGFRLSGGVSFNDVNANLAAFGSGTATINGNPVNMTGESYKMKVAFAKTTPYLGIGYGHNPAGKGLGFFMDFGLLFGKFKVTSEQTLVANGKATQADIDAQDQKVRDSVSGVNVLPTIQLGMSYRF